MRAVIAVARVIIVAGALLAIDGCDHASAGPNQAAPVKAETIADRQPPAAPSVAPAVNPQAIKYVSVVDASKAVVSGTSTLHDWTVNGGAIKGTADVSGQWKADAAAAIALVAIDLSIPVDSLKSTEGSGMDNTMYDALKLKQFPTIDYHLTKATFKSAPAKPGSPYHFDAAGNLTVAGGTHAVNLDLAVLPQDGGKLAISTEVGLQMTDFGVKPPTAMFGVVRSGDKITVKVNWQLTTAPAAGAGK